MRSWVSEWSGTPSCFPPSYLQPARAHRLLTYPVRSLLDRPHDLLERRVPAGRGELEAVERDQRLEEVHGRVAGGELAAELLPVRVVGEGLEPHLDARLP